MPSDKRVEELEREGHRLAQETANRCGIGNWRSEAIRILTPDERAEVNATWATMTGDASLVDAFTQWVGQRDAGMEGETLKSTKRRNAERDVLLADLLEWFRDEVQLYGADLPPRLTEKYTGFRGRIAEVLNRPTVSDIQGIRDKLERIIRNGV